MRVLKVLVALVVIVGGIGGVVIWKTGSDSGPNVQEQRSWEDRPIPIAVGSIKRGPIELRRVVSGTLEPHSAFTIASKIGGQITKLDVDFSDSVQKQQVVAVLDGAEIQQEVLQAEASVAVAEANLAEARSLWKISNREIERLNTLRDQAFLSDSDYENAEAEFLAREAQLRVAEARLRREEAVLESARIRQRYTTVSVDWEGSGERRLVAERYVEVGDTVSANQSLFRIVEINPITAVVYVTEKDYGYISVGKSATFETDAFPGEEFRGEVERISPVFREATRQARVELVIPNPELRLKPGMFVRVNLTLQRVQEATLVPEVAVTRRKDQEGVFVLDNNIVKWEPVEVLIREGDTLAIRPESLRGRVVTMGQHPLEEDSEVKIVEDSSQIGEMNR